MINESDNYFERLKYHPRERLWIAILPATNSDIEIYIQGSESLVSNEHLLRAKNILTEFERLNKLALDRINAWLKADFIEKLILSRIHVFDDVYSVTASPVSFIFTYEYGYENATDIHASRGLYLFCNMYSVKFLENGNVLSAESWFM